MSEGRRALVVVELRLAIEGDAIASITEASSDAPAAWLPSLVFERELPRTRARMLILVDGGRVEVPAAMQWIDSLEVLAMPDLLAAHAERSGVIGLTVLGSGLGLVCDPRRIAGAWR